MRTPAPFWLVGGLLVAALASACRTTLVEPLALAGPMPPSIGIWPLPDENAGANGPALLSDLDRAVRVRGYRVPSLAVGGQLLLDSKPDGSMPASSDLQAIGDALRVDALLRLDVRRFDAAGEPGRFRGASWDLQWTLVSTRGGGELWRYEHAGSWRQRDTVTENPHRAFDAEPDYVPIGGDRTPNFHSVAELAAELHRSAMDHLPAYTR